MHKMKSPFTKVLLYNSRVMFYSFFMQLAFLSVQMERETAKKRRFDFTHDPKVLEVQKRILGNAVSNCCKSSKIFFSHGFYTDLQIHVLHCTLLFFGRKPKSFFQNNTPAIKQPEVTYPCNTKANIKIESSKYNRFAKRNDVCLRSEFGTGFKYDFIRFCSFLTNSSE